MIIRSKAPLRIGLAGGGTDVSPYSDMFGGAILNATVSLYAYATIEPTNNDTIEFISLDRNINFKTTSSSVVDTSGELELHKGVYNRIVKDFNLKPLSFKLSTYVDAPPGSGLGTSSTLVVAMIGAFVEWLKLPLGEYDIAKLAYEVERVDLKMAGGKQDQYAATFGGVNFMEFYSDNKVVVNPLRIKDEYLHELSHNLVLYFTETSRDSSSIIESQTKNIKEKKSSSIEAMHHLKEQATMMKEALLKGEIYKIGEILDFGWQNKKNLTAAISNNLIDSIYKKAIDAGATGGKISGAGGGGFMIFYCPVNNRYKVINALQEFGGRSRRYTFTKEGLKTWTL